MFRAMVLKEWRETRGIALAALTAYAYLVASRLYPQLPFGVGIRQQWTIPFVRDVFVGWFGCIAVLMALALGLRQTLGESLRGTYPFSVASPGRPPLADRREIAGGAGVVRGVWGGRDCRVWPVGRHARYTFQPLRVVDDGAGLEFLVHRDALVPGRVSDRSAARAMVPLPASAVGGCGDGRIRGDEPRF